MAKDIILGLDVGIASVGWCITNNKDDNSIVKHGVRLFNTVDDQKKLLNETRRQKRSERRMNKRKFTLKRDFIKFLIENKYVKDIKVKDRKDNSFVNEFREKYLIPMDKRMNEEYKNEKMYWIYILRKKALTEKIEFNQMLSLLYWYLSNRGFKYEYKESNKKKEKNWWKIDVNDEISKFPIYLQIKNFKETGKFKSFYNRNFHKNDYVRELETIFKTQKLDKKLIDAFLNESNDKKGFFNRQRSFEFGPGSEKSPTPYGLYDQDEEKQPKWENIWEKTIGKCSLYSKKFIKPENRAPKGSFSAEVFNLLNDLNNLKIGIEKKKLTLEDKLKILKISFQVKSNLNRTIKYLVKKYKVSEEEIFGFKINKKQQLLLSSIKSYPIFEKLFGKIEFDFEDFKNFINQIINNKIDDFVNILSKTKEIEKRKKKIEDAFNISIDDEKSFNELSLKIEDTGTHSLSYKALKKYIPELLKQSDNFSSLSYEEWKMINKNDDFIKRKYFDKEEIKKWIKDELITSPNVKRSLHQTFGLLNAIIKYCDNNKLNISKIVIEMTRQTNSKRKIENIKNRQKYFEEINKKVNKILKKHKSKKNGLFNKIRLWIEQDGCDIYSGKPIDENDLINNPNNYDIDHIIPKFRSFDNTINNKVLTKIEYNSPKINQTPYEWLSTDHEKWLKFSIKAKELYGIENNSKNKKYKNRKKLENLLCTKDFNDPNEQLGFIKRNFVDTSYIARATLNKLEEFFKNKGTMIQTINGKMTSFARKYIESFEGGGLERPKDAGDSIDKNKMKKSRIWHGHHAEDAYLITLLSQTYKSNKIIEKYAYMPKELPKNKIFYFKWKNKYKELFKNLEVGQEILNKKMNDVAFSRKLELNSQLKGSEENLTGGKKIKNDEGETIKLQSFKYIYLWNLSTTTKNNKCEKYFGQNSKNVNDVILKNNEELYNALKKVYDTYKDSKYPFRKYFLENSKDKDIKKYSEYNAPIKFVYKNKKNKDVSMIIKKIKIKNFEKDIEDVFFGNEKNVSETKASFYSGLNWLEIHVYKNKKGNYQLIPINLKNSIFGKDNFKIIHNKLDKLNELEKMKVKYNVDKNQKPLYILNKNDIILKDNIEYFVCGLKEKINRLELKFLNKNFDKRIIEGINTFLSNSYLLKKDFLGNIISKSKIFVK